MAAIDDALAAGTGYFTTLVRVIASDATEVRVCLFDNPITFEGRVYDPAPFTPTQMQSKDSVEPDNGTITHLLDAVISNFNVRGGKWAGARIEVAQIDYRHPEWGATVKKIGRLGAASLKGLESETEFRGLMDLLGQPIGDRTSVLCRYTLGDAKCTVNLASYTLTGSVVSATNRQRFVANISPTPVDGYYKNGKITWTSGPNSGLSMETSDNTGNTIILFQPMIAAIAAGHNFSIVAGDDKSISTCYSKFANAINHGGEPDSPTREQIFTVPQ